MKVPPDSLVPCGVYDLAKASMLEKCLRVSTAEKRHNDQGNSFKGQHLIGTGLQFQRF